MDHWPSKGSLPRRMSRARPFSMTTPPTPTTGRSGYSREEVNLGFEPFGVYNWRNRAPWELTSDNAVYNTPWRQYRP